MRLVVLALVLVAAPTAAQAPDSLSTPADSSSGADSLSASAPVVPAPDPPAPLSQPSVYRSSATGLHLTLPAGWDGPVTVDESRLPGYALYSFASADSGLTLQIEQVVGLNPLERQRWRLGQTAYGYHGLRPVGPAATPLPGTAFELQGARIAGTVVFTQSGETFWTVHVQAPTSIWAGRRAEALAALAGVRIP